MSDRKVSMEIRLDDLTIAQAAALRIAFEQMKYLGSIGSSRYVCYFSDGDGNYRPKPQYKYPGVSKEDVALIEKHGELGKAGKWEGDQFFVDFDEEV